MWCGPEGFPEYFSLGRKQRGSFLWSEVGPTRTKRIAVFLWSWPWENQYLNFLCPFYTLMFLTCYITFICEFSRVTCLQKIQRKEIYSYFNESLRRAAFSTYKGSSKGTERGCILQSRMLGTLYLKGSFLAFSFKTSFLQRESCYYILTQDTGRSWHLLFSDLMLLNLAHFSCLSKSFKILTLSFSLFSHSFQSTYRHGQCITIVFI